MPGHIGQVGCGSVGLIFTWGWVWACAPVAIVTHSNAGKVPANRIMSSSLFFAHGGTAAALCQAPPSAASLAVITDSVSGP